MCGIVAYLGKKVAQPILIEGLKRLEYRGYDSAGVAMLSSGAIKIKKTSGRISALEQILDAPDGDDVLGTRSVDVIEHRRQRGRLARAGRPRHQDDAPAIFGDLLATGGVGEVEDADFGSGFRQLGQETSAAEDLVVEVGGENEYSARGDARRFGGGIEIDLHRLR